jgi:hypothetical protein
MDLAADAARTGRDRQSAPPWRLTDLISVETLQSIQDTFCASVRAAHGDHRHRRALLVHGRPKLARHGCAASGRKRRPSVHQYRLVRWACHGSHRRHRHRFLRGRGDRGDPLPIVLRLFPEPRELSRPTKRRRPAMPSWPVLRGGAGTGVGGPTTPVKEWVHGGFRSRSLCDIRQA